MKIYVHHMIDQLVEPPLKAIIWSVILCAALSVSHIVAKEFWPTLLHSVALVEVSRHSSEFQSHWGTDFNCNTLILLSVCWSAWDHWLVAWTSFHQAVLVRRLLLPLLRPVETVMASFVFQSPAGFVRLLLIVLFSHCRSFRAFYVFSTTLGTGTTT